MAWRRSLKKDGAALRWQAARARPPSGLDRLLASTHWPRTAAWAWQLPAFPAGGPRASADRHASGGWSACRGQLRELARWPAGRATRHARAAAIACHSASRCRLHAQSIT
jgi:hypothetical protein